MKKKFEIFGRKVPVLAVIMAVLIIGTASAALITNYATISGTFEVEETITVIGDGEYNDLIIFDVNGIGEFTIENTGSVEDVDLVTTLYLNMPLTIPDGNTTSDYMVTDTEGITISYNPGTPSIPTDIAGVYDAVTVAAIGGTVSTPGVTVVTVTFGADPAVVIGEYTIQVEANPTIIP